MISNPIIWDDSGRFYAGMTLRDARINGTDKSVWRRDFRNLDKDKNGQLSVDEIIKERNRSSKMNKIGAGLALPLGCLDFFINKNDKICMGVDLAITAVLMLCCLNSASKIDKKTKEYEEIIKTHNIDRYV